MSERERAARLSPYLSGWERTLTEQGDLATFRRGGFTIHLHGSHNVRLTGRGIDENLRFYRAAVRVMETEER